MSLRVWLPLNGTLDNKGLDNVTVINNGATVDNNGKIGKCYSFGTGNSYIIIDSTPLKTFTEFSFACWVKIISWNTNYSTIFAAKNSTATSWNNLIFSLLRSGSNSNLCFNISNGTNYTATSCYTGILSTNTWYHIVCTYEEGKIKLYQDGNIVNTYNTTVIPNFDSIVNLWIGKSNENSYQSNNLLNDVRIYNHALSPLEVKQISQGLILHYPLNRGGWGQENLLLKQINSNSWSNWNSGNNTWVSENIREKIVIDNKVWAHVHQFSASSYGGYSIEPSQNGIIIDSTKQYTWSCLAKAGNDTNAEIILWYHWRSTEGGANLSQNSKKFILSSNPVRISWTLPQYINNTYNVNRINLMMGTSGTANNEIYFTDVKFEEGSIATPWCPNSSDTLATTMGLNDNVEYDTSGYGNNGTKAGTFSWTSDTPKYNVSTSFDGSAKIERDSLMGEVYTLSCWAKTTKNKSTSQMIVVDSNSQMAIAFYNGTIIGVYGTTRSTGSKCTLSGSNYKENEWNHFVVVKTSNDGKRNIYCNGELLTPSSDDYWSSAPNNFAIGARNTSTPYYFYGEISDVCVYATALSAEDVKSLYQNSAYIDNQGNIYGAVYEEV